MAHNHTIHAHKHHIGWNNAFAPVLHVAPGETVSFETVDSSGGQFSPAATLETLKALDFGKLNPVTGPVFVDGADLAAWRDALSQKTAMVLLETPSNPMLDIVDLRAVCDLAHAAGALVVVDNVFATPLLQRPQKFGADIVVYSATKHMDGQGRVLGGAVLASQKWIDEVFQPFFRNTGPAMSPFNAWVILKGLETMALRVAAQSENAEKIADFLAGHPKIARSLYPTRPDHPQQKLAMAQMSGGGTIVAFELKGGKDAAFAMMNAFQIIGISNNLGDTKSLATHPATTTHMRIGPEERAKLGITDGIVRLSVGLEDSLDLIEDLAQALSSA